MATTSTTKSAAAKPAPHPINTEPDRDCPLCPRLVAFRETNRAQKPQWFNAPVPGFGDRNGRLAIVGLAPGLQGANRTGRPFTGDYAGDLLYATLIEYGFATGTYQARPDDGMMLVDCRIANGVHCVPPQNKPLPAEIANCRPFLLAAIESMPRLPPSWRSAASPMKRPSKRWAFAPRPCRLDMAPFTRPAGSAFMTAITARATTRTRAS